MREVVGRAEVDLEAERRGDLLAEEAPERAAVRVHAAHQLALVPAEAHAVVAVALPRRPRGALLRDRGRQPVEVPQDARVEALVHHRQAGLVPEQLADGDLALARLRELGPVRRYALVVVEPAARVGQRERHRREPLRGRVHEHERVLLPRRPVARVADAAPEVHHLLAAHVRGDRPAELAALVEVPRELALDLLEARGYEPAIGLADGVDHLELDQAVQLDGVLHRQLLRDRLDEAVHDHRGRLLLGEAA